MKTKEKLKQHKRRPVAPEAAKRYAAPERPKAPGTGMPKPSAK